MANRQNTEAMKQIKGGVIYLSSSQHNWSLITEICWLLGDTLWWPPEMHRSASGTAVPPTGNQRRDTSSPLIQYSFLQNQNRHPTYNLIPGAPVTRPCCHFHPGVSLLSNCIYPGICTVYNSIHHDLFANIICLFIGCMYSC